MCVKQKPFAVSGKGRCFWGREWPGSEGGTGLLYSEYLLLLSAPLSSHFHVLSQKRSSTVGLLFLSLCVFIWLLLSLPLYSDWPLLSPPSLCAQCLPWGVEVGKETDYRLYWHCTPALPWWMNSEPFRMRTWAVSCGRAKKQSAQLGSTCQFNDLYLHMML